MRVIYLPTGEELKPKSAVRFDDGTGFDVISIVPGVSQAFCYIRAHPSGRLQEIRMRVRFNLPGFRLQWVALFPDLSRPPP